MDMFYYLQKGNRKMTEEQVIEKEVNEFLPAEVLKLNAVELFNEKNRNLIIEHVRKKAFEIEPDLTTQKGRDAIKSQAYQVSRSKTFIDGIGADAVKERKEEIKAFDRSRKIVKDTLDAIRDEVRKPLTDWEEAEKARVEEIQNKLTALKDLDSFHNQLEITSQLIAERLEQAKTLVIDESYGEYEHMAKDQLAGKIAILEQMYQQKSQYEKEQAELAILRKEKEERDLKEQQEKAEKERLEREEQIRREAAEQAKKDKEAAELRAKEAEERAAIEKAESEKRAEQAREQARIDAEKAAERAREEEKERQRVELAQKQKEDAERAKNEEHVKKIESEAIESLYQSFDKVAPTDMLTREMAEIIIAIISDNEVKHVTINF